MRTRVLVVDWSTPTPDRDSGSASTFSYLQILSAAGYDVTFAPDNLNRTEPYSSDIEQLGVRTLSKPEWNSMEEVLRSFGPNSDVILFFRVSVASGLFDLAREAAPNAKIIFHAVDLHFLRTQRQAEIAGQLTKAASDINALREAETDLMKRADAAIVVSATEHELIRELVPEANVHHIPILRSSPPTIPASTKRSYERPRSAIRRLFKRLSPQSMTPRDRRDILFVGGFAHKPNVDAIEWFVNEIWPKMLLRGFRHNFIVVGPGTPPHIRALASKRIIVRGHVKELKPVLGHCRLSVAPLRYGGGVKGKIVTSLSEGLPVVATSMAAEGMGLRHGESILIADSPEDFAEQILRIYEDDQLWLKVSANGRQAFDTTFSHSSGAPKILALVESLRAAKIEPPSPLQPDRTDGERPV